MKSRTVVCLSNNADDRNAANLLGQAFFSQDQTRVVGFADNFFNEISKEELGELVFLGHGNREQYDEHTHKTFAKEFLRKFNVAYGTNKKEKDRVKHIYLVGCELGLIDENGDSLAQKIAAELYKNGFKNKELTVHAVAAIQTTPEDSLIVEVITQAGIEKLLANFKEYRGGAVDASLIKEGNISAHVKNDQETSLVVKGADPRYELNKPANTFSPKKEKVEVRLKRVEDQSMAAESFSRAEAIALLYSRKEYLRSRGVHNAPKALVLARYIDKLNAVVNEPDKQWHEVMQEILNELRTDHRVFFKNQGATEKLILNLSNRKDYAVERLVERQSEREQALADKRSSDNTKPKIVVRKSGNSNNATQPEVEAVKMSARANELPADVQEEIKELIAKLKSEIKILSQGCPGFFKAYERNTKLAKLTTLKKFIGDDGVSVTREQAYEFALAASKDKRVMRSAKTSRTSDIIHQIVNTQEQAPSREESASSRLLTKKRQ